MTQPQYTTCNNPNAGFQNGGITMQYGAKGNSQASGNYIQKDDGTKPIPNAGKTKIANVQLSNRVISNTNTVIVTDTTLSMPAVDLLVQPWGSTNSGIISTGGPLGGKMLNLYDGTSFDMWSTLNPITSLPVAGPSGNVDFFGTNLAAVGFSGYKGFMWQDQVTTPIHGFGSGVKLGLSAIGAVPLTGALTWDVFAVIKSPAISSAQMCIFAISENVTNSNQGYNCVGTSYAQPTIFWKGHGSSATNYAVVGSGTTLVNNTAYLLHYYASAIDGNLHMRVNNKEQTIVASGASPTNAFALGYISGQSLTCSMSLGGYNTLGATTNDYAGYLGALRVYGGLSQAAKSGVASYLAGLYGITLLA